MRDWKATLAGIVFGVITRFGPAIGGRILGNPNPPPITAGNYLPGIGLAVLGALAKDGDVTGGTRRQ